MAKEEELRQESEILMSMCQELLRDNDAIIRRTKALEYKITLMEEEITSLAISQCHNGYLDDDGSHRCGFQDTIDHLENAIHLLRMENQNLRDRLAATVASTVL